MSRIEVIGDATLYLGDCTEIAKELSGIHSCTTDPPYHLTSIVKRFGASNAAPAKVGKTGAFARASRGFMGQTWDGGDVAFQPETWAVIEQALLPGAHLVAFSGTRTYHRMACAIEDAGFEIRDMLSWLYGSGFPKSHSVTKNGCGDEWQGWGTALKPACEPICFGRKPLMGTVAENVLEHGTGAINIDGCRVETDEVITATRNIALGSSGSGVYGAANVPGVYKQKDGGRWPANVIHDGSDEVVSGFPETGVSSGGSGAASQRTALSGHVYGQYSGAKLGQNAGGLGDSGSAARFFYTAKASKDERGEGNNHPTVKPTDLMKYLCRLITPPRGIVLDPFMGSGSTGVAAMLEGFRFVGIEQSPEYFDIACRRIEAAYQERSSTFFGYMDRVQESAAPEVEQPAQAEFI